MKRTTVLILAILLVLTGCRSTGKNVDSTTCDTTFADTTINDTTTVDDQTTLPNTENVTSGTTAEESTTIVETTSEPIDAPNLLNVSQAISGISAKNAFVYNSTTDELLGIKSEGENFSPASITKLLTALYALEAAPTDLVIAPKAEELALVGKNSSIAYIKTHHKLTVSQLIQGMLMPSGNDAAYTIAAGVGRYIAGDPDMNGKDAVDLFVAKMNEYAVKIGCTGTSFTVPDGLAGSEHYTTVHDMIIIGKLAINDPIISKYAKTVSEKVYYASGHSITWNNSNYLINPNNEYYSPYVNGLKTGSLSGNYCVYVSAVINDNTYLIGIFGSPTKSGRYDDAHTLINAILEDLKEAG